MEETWDPLVLFLTGSLRSKVLRIMKSSKCSKIILLVDKDKVVEFGRELITFIFF